jgi:hypothetical protein
MVFWGVLFPICSQFCSQNEAEFQQDLFCTPRPGVADLRIGVGEFIGNLVELTHGFSVRPRQPAKSSQLLTNLTTCGQFCWSIPTKNYHRLTP